MDPIFIGSISLSPHIFYLRVRPQPIRIGVACQSGNLLSCPSANLDVTQVDFQRGGAKWVDGRVIPKQRSAFVFS